MRICEVSTQEFWEFRRFRKKGFARYQKEWASAPPLPALLNSSVTAHPSSMLKLTKRPTEGDDDDHPSLSSSAI
eukprot:1142642-Pelagomonas_calceolata.AAC.2